MEKSYLREQFQLKLVLIVINTAPGENIFTQTNQKNAIRTKTYQLEEKIVSSSLW